MIKKMIKYRFLAGNAYLQYGKNKKLVFIFNDYMFVKHKPSQTVKKKFFSDVLKKICFTSRQLDSFVLFLHQF